MAPLKLIIYEIFASYAVLAFFFAVTLLLVYLNIPDVFQAYEIEHIIHQNLLLEE
jgi:hypothetical protein